MGTTTIKHDALLDVDIEKAISKADKYMYNNKKSK
jgi:hypothetical protein